MKSEVPNGKGETSKVDENDAGARPVRARGPHGSGATEEDGSIAGETFPVGVGSQETRTGSAETREVIEGSRRWAVVQGDCLALLPTLLADHVISDPPYDDRTHDNAVTTGASGATGIPEFGSIDAYDLGTHLVLSARRWCIAFCALEQLGLYAAGVGAAWVRSGVWDKIAPMPQLTGDRPGQAVEGVAIMHREGKKRWNGGGRAAIWRHMVERGQKSHPTQKPVALMVEIIQDFTDPDDVILDPFCGSGTTLVAALRCGRRAIGIEMNEQWAELSRDRCRAEDASSTVYAMRMKQQPLFK